MTVPGIYAKTWRTGNAMSDVNVLFFLPLLSFSFSLMSWLCSSGVISCIFSFTLVYLHFHCINHFPLVSISYTCPIVLLYT